MSQYKQHKIINELSHTIKCEPTTSNEKFKSTLWTALTLTVFSYGTN